MARFAAIQFHPEHSAPAQNRAHLEDLLDRAGSMGANLAVAPEMAITGYVWPDADAIRPYCEPGQGPTHEVVARACRRHGMWAVVGFAESAPDGLYNSAMVVDGDGALRAVYRKNLLFELDTTWATPGQDRVIVDTPWGRVAPAICMDLNDDRFTRWLNRERPDIIAFCTNWVDQGVDILPYWRARLYGWRGWFVAADAWGLDSGVRMYGRSAILGPHGRLVALAEAEGDAVLLGEVDVDE